MRGRERGVHGIRLRRPDLQRRPGLDQALLPEVIIGLGRCRSCVTDAGHVGSEPGTRAFVESYDALLLGQPRPVTLRAGSADGFYRMETVEHFAKILLAAENAGTRSCSLP